MSKPKAPAAPDPTATINAQTASNRETALTNAALNRVNQVTPYGSSIYTTDGTDANGVPSYTQTINLDPSQRQLLDQSNQGSIALGNTKLGMLGQIGNSYRNPIDTSGSPGIAYGAQGNGPNITGQIGSGDYTQQIKDAQDAAYRSQTQYLDPQYEQGQKAMDNSLINQGITQGSEAGNNAQNNFALQKQRAYQSAQDAATLAGQNEQNVLFGQDATRGQFQNQANQQGFNQAYQNAGLQNQGNAQFLQQLFALRNQPLNEYNALSSGSQVTNPTFGNVPGATQANTDVVGATNQGYQNQMAGYNASMQGINNLFSLGGSLGSAALLSDRRLKRDIKRVGQTSSGIPTYTFRYNNDDEQTYFGVMADEVAHIPGARVLMDNGFYGVNYSVLK